MKIGHLLFGTINLLSIYYVLDIVLAPKDTAVKENKIPALLKFIFLCHTFSVFSNCNLWWEIHFTLSKMYMCLS